LPAQFLEAGSNPLRIVDAMGPERCHSGEMKIKWTNGNLGQMVRSDDCFNFGREYPDGRKLGPVY